MQAEMVPGQSGCGRPGGTDVSGNACAGIFRTHSDWPIAGEEGTDMWQKEQVIDEFQKRGMADYTAAQDAPGCYSGGKLDKLQGDFL